MERVDFERNEHFRVALQPRQRPGDLERALPSYALVREAFYLYFPSRRNLPPKLRVFADWFRSKNEPRG